VADRAGSAMTPGVLASLERHIEQARVALGGDDHETAATVALALMRNADAMAASMPHAPGTDSRTARAIIDLRNELGCRVLAAQQLGEAGVPASVVVGVLRRGTETASGILRTLDRAAS